ncbi:MAG: response regulator transcription factor [Piscinibacter sp.]
MRLLLAEDDTELGRATSKYLLRDGHAVDWVTNGNQLLELSGRYSYDCLLLDLGLPELDGQDCLVNLRSGGNSTPVIVTTARGFREHRIRLLDLGADDYLVKPYDLSELVARIKAIVRRSQASERLPEGELVLGPLRLQPLSNSVQWHDNAVVLTAREFRVLEVLLRRQGRVVTRQQLEAEVYGWNENVGSNAIEVHIHNLRRKFGAELIVTLRGVGYQLGPL